MKQKVTFYDCDDISFAKAKTIIIIIMLIEYIPGYQTIIPMVTYVQDVSSTVYAMYI